MALPIGNSSAVAQWNLSVESILLVCPGNTLIMIALEMSILGIMLVLSVRNVGDLLMLKLEIQLPIACQFPRGIGDRKQFVCYIRERRSGCGGVNVWYGRNES